MSVTAIDVRQIVCHSRQTSTDGKNSLFDARTFLTAELGGPQNVPDLFTRYGFTPPNAAAVEKWWQRSSIPVIWFVKILAILELERGEPIPVANYVSWGSEENAGNTN